MTTNIMVMHARYVILQLLYGYGTMISAVIQAPTVPSLDSTKQGTWWLKKALA